MNNEARNLMVKRVQEAYEKWPNYEDMPIASPEGMISYEIEGDTNDNSVYVAALYELSMKVAPAGRAESTSIIYGKADNGSDTSLNLDNNPVTK